MYGNQPLGGSGYGGVIAKAGEPVYGRLLAEPSELALGVAVWACEIPFVASPTVTVASRCDRSSQYPMKWTGLASWGTLPRTRPATSSSKPLSSVRR